MTVGMDVDNTENSNTEHLSAEELAELEERRQLRKQYRDLMVDTDKNQHELMYGSSAQLVERMNVANELYSRVRTTNDATLDSRLLVANSALGARHTRYAMSQSSALDIGAFMDKVRLFLRASSSRDLESRDELDWHKLSAAAECASRRAPDFQFILGPLSMEKKPVARPVRAKRDDGRQQTSTHAELKPQELKVGQLKNEVSETTRNIAEVYNALLKSGPLPYWRFAINPSSFSQSVENVFYCAFLVKEGRAALLEESDDGLVVKGDCLIQASEPSSEEDRGTYQRHQFMVSLDMKSWQQLIEKYNVHDTVIPHRPSSI